MSPHTTPRVSLELGAANRAPKRHSCGPDPSLSRQIDWLWGVEQVHSPQFAIPDGSVDLLVSLAPEPGAFVLGAMRTATLIDRPPGHTLVGVSLRPGAAALVLGCSAHELTDKFVSLELVLGRAARPLLDRMRHARDFAERSRVLAAFVDARVGAARATSQPPPSVSGALKALRASSGRLSIEALARAQGCTPRVLQRAFLRHVGLSPKQYAGVTRFHAALRGLQSGRPMSELAFELGYADQAHFIRSFGALAGKPPSAFRDRPELTHLFNTDRASPPRVLVIT